MSQPYQASARAPLQTVCVHARVRKPSAEQPVRAVHLSITSLQPLFSVKQEEAAAMLGLSLTSLKSACRRLGLSRWPYTRPRLGGGSEASESVLAEVEASHDEETAAARADAFEVPWTPQWVADETGGNTSQQGTMVLEARALDEVFEGSEEARADVSWISWYMSREMDEDPESFLDGATTPYWGRF
ncbi:hypothetical protein GUITHDRAFT_104386 [Guillardia theta CCMP2712]|uniref:RWP-RK domain-containing protein n=1 Tax=Guillardia theta (strain CCMP2712) TaxID=905079 RepID=L1JP67_GUITC|nr:hypothetical protein GUITHDRAFT_104386 [Guillardia theta CCMP2712]EKX49990.1 hypothetical protein GUITHDRAFT_104386 [Guillardia theta CCMP2712]|eukprot:XP_005836970.1 hypothetical protein GUITHDRAFT_104386 [Guillardia theta CCMP2712]